ncbi:MAG: Ig-like domain-containing protein [Anaerolineae bacterium]|nr:Ig-like domain-containing protein [Anaerolineae bacterium]
MQKRHFGTSLIVMLALLIALIACAREDATPSATPPASEDRTTDVATPDEPASAENTDTESNAPETAVIADWPPQLVYSSPLPGEQVTLDGAITLRFDQPMDRTSVESAFAVAAVAETDVDGAESEESAEPVEGAFTWTGDDTLIYTPADKLGRARLYQVTVGETARGQNGKLLQDALRLNFRTVGYLDVSQVIPADSTEDVQADGAITVMFNRPVVPLVTTAQQDDLPQPLTIEPDTAGSGEWISTSIYRFVPDNGFDGGTEYSVTVNAGLEDVVGSVLAEDHVTTFTTAPPSVVKFEHDGDPSQLDPTQPISITFNMPMDRTTTEAAVTMTPSAEYTVTWRDGDRVMMLIPDPSFALETTYRIDVDDSATSASGATLARSANARMTTYPYPGVDETYPRNRETGASWNGINITFVSPMNGDTLENSITISPEPLDGYRIDFWPESQFMFINTLLERNTTYEVTLSGDVEDIYGNKMGEDYMWSFTTADYEPLATFNLPPNVSQLSTSFPSIVDVVYRRVSGFDVSLYDFDGAIPANLLGQPYQVNDPDVAPTDPIGEWSYSVSSIEDELGSQSIELATDGGVLPTGVYLLDIDAPELGENAYYWQYPRNLLIVADTNLVVKETFNHVHVWATDLESGEPSAGLNIAFYYDGVNIGSATTDNDGLATLAKSENGRNSGTLAVAGTPGEPGFGAGSSQWSLSVEPWQFGITYGWEDERPYYAYIYTDRPIYRPGDTVNIRGVLRATNYGRYGQPDLSDVTLKLLPAYSYTENATQEEAIEVVMDENGGFSAEYIVPENATLGTYNIIIDSPDFDYNSNREFTVAEYRAPEILVTSTAAVDEGLRGEPAQFTVDVSYFFGGPAADLDVTWSLSSEPYYLDTGNYQYSFAPSAYQPWNPFIGIGVSSSQWIADGMGKTDGNGQLVVDISADALAAMPEGSRNLMFEATVTDLTGFLTSARTTAVQHAAETYVGIGMAQPIAAAETETEVELRTVDWNGDIVPNAAVEVVFYEREWRSIRDDFNPSQVYWEPVDTEVTRVAVTTDSNGAATATFVPDKGGSYVAEATVTDSGGRTQVSNLDFWVMEEGYAAWRFDPQDRKMTLVADQQEYKVGDTARILVQSPFPEPVTAWLVIERGEQIEERLITVDGSTVLELPLSADYAPNVFVTVVAIKPVDDSDRPWADMRLGITEIPVSPEGLRLELALSPDQDVVSPGADVTYDITITDADGNPVSADFSLAMVDLAVLQLKPDNAPDILEAFYSRQPYRSQIGSGILYSGEGLAITEPSNLGGYGGGGGGGDVAAESLALRSEEGSDGVRQDFRDTAYWEPRLTTDGAGQATVTVDLPDNLTTWRLSAKAATVDTLVGQDDVDIIATKPVLIRPITPRFFTVGDQVSLGAVVNNNTDAPVEAAVTLEATGLIFTDDPTAASQTISVTIPAHSGEAVRWPVTVLDVDESDLVFSVDAGEYSDASKPTVSRGEPLPVYRFDASDFTATAGSFDQEGRRVEAILLPPITDTRIGDVKLRLNASLASGILDGLEALKYEQDALYQCAHVAASYLLPNSAMALALRDLSFSDVLLQADLDAQIPLQIATIEETQHSNGGWSWCGSPETDEYLSAYVLFALLKADEAGYDVSDKVITDGIAFVDRALVSAETLKTTSDANRQAFYLYVLATAGEDVGADLDELFDTTRDLLDPYAKALMLSAYAAIGSDSNQDILLSDLNNSVILSATGAHWEDQMPDWDNLSSDVRGTAMVIDALATVDPGNTIISNAVRWLMSARELVYWPTLHEGAWSMLALTDVMTATGELDAAYDYAVAMNFEPVAEGQFTPADVARADLVTIPIDEMLIDELNYLDIQRSAGDGVLYYTAHLNAFLDANQVDPVERGIVVSRQYFDAACDPLTETCEPITTVTSDQQVRVELTIIAPNDLTYAVIEDPLPAGAEAIDPNLETSSTAFEPGNDQPAPYSYGYWGWWYFNGIEFRDEKVVFSSAYLPAGTYQYTYYLQPVIPGEFQVMPATARQEFFPEVFGRSAGEVLTIE